MNKRLATLHRLALSTLSSLLVLHSAVSFADDTEIFFGGAAISDDVRPNVLFILDNSGSMAWRTDSNTTATGSEQSRMSVLKESFSTIINSAGAINAGVMVLNTRTGYDGRMVYPVTNIDNTLVAVNQIPGSPSIRASGDDATQSSLGGGADISGTSLQMGYIGSTTVAPQTDTIFLANNDAFFQSRFSNTDWACRMDEPGNDHNPNNDACGNNDRANINIKLGNDTNTADTNPIRGTALFYFSGLNIPASAGLQPGFTAYLELRPTNNDNSNLPTISTTLQRSKTPGPLNDLTQVDPGRTYVPTSNLTATSWLSGTTSRIDITDLVKDVLDDDADALQSVFLKLRATSSSRDYIFCTRSCGNTGGISNAPRIVISYDKTSNVTETRTGVLRFQDVGIPRGATVQSARIDFVPKAASPNPDPVTFQVRAEKVADAATINAGSNVITRATKTTALTTWSPPVWTVQNPPIYQEGPDVRAVVQEVVDQSTWCGNNAMAFHISPSAGTGLRTSFSIDGAKGLQPTLTITYTGGSTGCLNPIIEQIVTSQKNDGFEQANGAMILDGATLPLDRSMFAARYEAMPIKKNATILETQLILTPVNTVNDPNITTTVSFDNTSNSAPLTGSANNLSSRVRTTDGSCIIDNWVTSDPVSCNASQLRTGLQSIVNRSDWAPGNAITVLSAQSSDTDMDLHAYESNPAQSIKLRIKVSSGGIINSDYTVRQHINGLVQAMGASGGTPIVPTYYDAAKYLKGELTGYTSPITSACQSTHVVLLSDGQANGFNSASQDGIKAWNGGTSCTGDSTDNDEKCGRTLATYLNQIDQSPFTGVNFVTTNSIGFALNASLPSTAAKTFLSALANNGGGTAYTAENASQLSAAFSQIIQDVLSTDTTFVSPGATVNQFNRQSNKNEVYFALFKPSENNRWVGNLKRYALNSGTGDIILDADNVGAVDLSTGFFKSGARSFWTPIADGNDTAKGGTANQLPAPASRKAYTYIGSSPVTPVSLTGAANLLTNANTAITAAQLGAADAGERTALINWIRGLNDDTSSRKSMGDPLHSVPRLVTYKCNSFSDTALTQCSSEEQSAFVGTNEGFVHAFDTNTGAEQMAFMPQELLPNIKALKANARSTSLAPRKYGMDNTVAIWVNDLNNNGVIYGGRNPAVSTPTLLSGLNSGEFVYAYATMGRGGRNLYSLDITDPSAPKLRWYITPSTPGFARLGQTWSTPVVTKVKIGTTEKQVLIFSGGYDESQDDVTILNQNGNSLPRLEDAYGNAIYMVDATSGELIWSGSSQVANTAAQSHQQLSKMRYSMPSSLRVIDINRDGLADQFFVGDMGGQVWRFFIENGNAVGSLISPLDSATGTIADGVFANVIPADTGSETATQKKAKLRRFYNEPDVALLTVNEGQALVVNIGSGFRGHPLDAGAQDRFYSFRTPIIGANSSHTILTESAMYDATLNLAQQGTASEKAAAASEFAKNTGGWYIRLENSGEKVLAEATTFNGQVFFNTYEPNSNSVNSSCKAVIGTPRAYAVNLFDATVPPQRIIGTPNRANRSSVLKTSGIPPKPLILFPDGRTQPVKMDGPEGEELPFDGTVGPTYWIDEL